MWCLWEGKLILWKFPRILPVILAMSHTLSHCPDRVELPLNIPCLRKTSSQLPNPSHDFPLNVIHPLNFLEEGRWSVRAAWVFVTVVQNCWPQRGRWLGLIAISMCLPCNRTGLIALFTLVFLCPIRASASYRRQLLAVRSLRLHYVDVHGRMQRFRIWWFAILSVCPDIRHHHPIPTWRVDDGQSVHSEACTSCTVRHAPHKLVAVLDISSWAVANQFKKNLAVMNRGSRLRIWLEWPHVVQAPELATSINQNHDLLIVHFSRRNWHDDQGCSIDHMAKISKATAKTKKFQNSSLPSKGGPTIYTDKCVGWYLRRHYLQNHLKAGSVFMWQKWQKSANAGWCLTRRFW